MNVCLFVRILKNLSVLFLLTTNIRDNEFCFQILSKAKVINHYNYYIFDNISYDSWQKLNWWRRENGCGLRSLALQLVFAQRIIGVLYHTTFLEFNSNALLL